MLITEDTPYNYTMTIGDLTYSHLQECTKNQIIRCELPISRVCDPNPSQNILRKQTLAYQNVVCRLSQDISNKTAICDAT